MSMDAAWASLRDDAEVTDRYGYTPEPPDDDDRPILSAPLRPLPRPPAMLLNQNCGTPKPTRVPPPFRLRSWSS